ncbi:MAG: GNAT family N-acetyltransferase [Crocinitomicaceae bacterium]
MHFNKISELPTLETERLLLRPFRIEDVPSWYIINKDPEITRYTGDGGVVSKEEIERRIREHVLGDYSKYGFGRWAVVHKENDELIGFAGLKYMPDLDVVDLGYRFKQDYWGQGIATEASRASLKFGFETLGLTQIVAYILPENVGSEKVLKKLNFSFVRSIVEEGELEHEYVLTVNKYNQT